MTAVGGGFCWIAETSCSLHSANSMVTGLFNITLSALFSFPAELSRGGRMLNGSFNSQLCERIYSQLARPALDLQWSLFCCVCPEASGSRTFGRLVIGSVLLDTVQLILAAC